MTEPDKEVGIKGGQLALVVATISRVPPDERPAELWRILAQERDPLVLQTALTQCGVMIKALAETLNIATGDDTATILLQEYGKRLAIEEAEG